MSNANRRRSVSITCTVGSQLHWTLPRSVYRCTLSRRSIHMDGHMQIRLPPLILHRNTQTIRRTANTAKRGLHTEAQTRKGAESIPTCLILSAPSAREPLKLPKRNLTLQPTSLWRRNQTKRQMTRRKRTDVTQHITTRDAESSIWSTNSLRCHVDAPQMAVKQDSVIR